MPDLKKILLISVIAVFGFASVHAYSCKGNEVGWTCNTTNTSACGSSPTCLPFSGEECSFFREPFTLQRCVPSTAYNNGSDLFAYTSISTYNNSEYTLSFDWDGLVSNQECTGGRYNVLRVDVRNSTFNGTIIKNVTRYCSGTLCGNDSIPGYKSESFKFTSQSNNTVVVFRTLSGQAVQIKVKNFEITGDNLPCQLACGGSPFCAGYLPGTNFSICNMTTLNTFSDDLCDDNCQLTSSGTCRSSSYHASCTAPNVCANHTANTCLNNTNLCYSNCSYHDRDEAKIYCEVDSSTCSNATWLNNACCGDDDGEYVTNCTVINGTCASQACCLFETNCAWNNTCYADGTTITPGTECNPNLTCNDGSWTRTITQQDCAACGTWVEDVGRCCFSDSEFSYEGGYCDHGTLTPFSIELNPWNDEFVQDTSIVFNSTISTELRELTLNLSYEFIKDDEVLKTINKTRTITNGSQTFVETMQLPEATALGDYSVRASTTYEDSPVNTAPTSVSVVKEIEANQTEENQTEEEEDLILTVEDTTGQTIVVVAVFAVIGIVLMSIIVYLRQNL